MWLWKARGEDAEEVAKVKGPAPIPLYPLLASVYLALTLAEWNAREWLDVSEVLSPVLISLGVAVVLLIATTALTKDPHKRLLLAAVGVLIFDTYGGVRESIG